LPDELIPGGFDGLRHHLERLPVPSLLTRIRWKASASSPRVSGSSSRLRSHESATAGRRATLDPPDSVGAMLGHLPDQTHGWPQGSDFPEVIDWQDALRSGGCAAGDLSGPGRAPLGRGQPPRPLWN